MTEQDEQPDEEVETEAGGPKAGERLAAARRDMQISVVEVAKELHLDETKVRALERNEFEALGAAVFAKGHLRKYAEIVDVDIDDIMTDYYQLTRGDSAPPIVAGRARQRQELSPGPWIAVAIVVIVIAAAYWWFGIRTPASLPSTSPPPQASPVETATEAPAQTPDSSDPEPVATESAPVTEAIEMPEQADDAAEVADESTDASAVAEITDTVASAEPAAAEPLRISLAFSGDCWTEISDADGRRMYFGMGRDGQSVDLTGTAPVTVLFGNGSNVSLFVDGEAYALPPINPSNQTVRLSLDKRR